MPDYTIDTLIDDTYGKPSYVAKKPRPIQVSFRLDSTKNDDIAIERILSNWADKREKNKNIKAAIGLYHAMADRNDIQFLEDNYPNVIAEIQLAGRREMQEQIDELKQEIIALRKRLNQSDDTQTTHHNAIGMMLQYPAFRYIKQVTPLNSIVVTKQNKLTDGSK